MIIARNYKVTYAYQFVNLCNSVFVELLTQKRLCRKTNVLICKKKKKKIVFIFRINDY